MINHPITVSVVLEGGYGGVAGGVVERGHLRGGGLVGEGGEEGGGAGLLHVTLRCNHQI